MTKKEIKSQVSVVFKKRISIKALASKGIWKLAERKVSTILKIAERHSLNEYMHQGLERAFEPKVT